MCLQTVLSHCQEEVRKLLGHGHHGYIGHYVVLAQVDWHRQTCLVIDPAYPDGPVEMSGEELEEARHAFGTDEDVLVVELP